MPRRQQIRRMLLTTLESLPDGELKVRLIRCLKKNHRCFKKHPKVQSNKFAFSLAYSYLCRRFTRGCSQCGAEMIPIEPDAGNAAEGMSVNGIL